MTAQVLLLLAGVGALYFGAEWLVRGSARLASALGVSPIIVGLTVVSLGTSAPELVVAVVAAVRGSGDLAVGNVMGSNLANIGLILGLSAMVRPLDVAARVVSREVPIMLMITFLIYPLVWDLNVGRVDGGILLVILTGYLFFLFRSSKREAPEVLGEYESFAESQQHLTPAVLLRDLGLIVGGAIGLAIGGTALVESATVVARALGMSELVIGLSVVAIGTSLPELATSMVAAFREESDIAVGNVIGSNIFNLTSVLGIAALVEPLEVTASILSVELPAVLILSLLVLPVVRSRYTIRRWEGGLLLASYLILGVWVFLDIG